MKPETLVEVPESTQLSLVTPDGDSFESLVYSRQQIKEHIVQHELQVKALDQKIGAIMDLNQLKSVTCDGTYLVSRREGSTPRKTIDKAKLLELGVPAYTIAAATVEGKPGQPGIAVRRVNDKGDGEAN